MTPASKLASRLLPRASRRATSVSDQSTRSVRARSARPARSAPTPAHAPDSSVGQSGADGHLTIRAMPRFGHSWSDPMTGELQERYFERREIKEAIAFAEA